MTPGGIAQMMRVGLYKPVHVKTIRSQEIRMLLTARKFVQTKITDAENNLRGLCATSALRLGSCPASSSSSAFSSCWSSLLICG